MFTTIKKHIPNTITSLNLLSGCMALVAIFNNDFKIAAYFVLAAAFFDFFDGLAARALKAYSLIGIQLDSLADMVSFGVVPATMLYKVMENNSNCNCLLIYFPFVIAVFSALRLAKFNVDDRQHDSFLGLPTPANSIFIVSTVAASYNYSIIQNLISNAYIVVVVSFLLSYLLVSEIQMFSLKFKPQKNKADFIRKYIVQIVFLTISAVVIAIFGFLGLSFTIFTYIVVSIIKMVFK